MGRPMANGVCLFVELFAHKTAAKINKSEHFARHSLKPTSTLLHKMHAKRFVTQQLQLWPNVFSFRFRCVASFVLAIFVPSMLKPFILFGLAVLIHATI